MRLIKLGNNESELDLGFCQVFFSYQTPVAARLTGGALVKTSEKYSSTTTKHINKWLDGCQALERDQDFLNDILTGSSHCGYA
jgi:hypothetical protein